MCRDFLKFSAKPNYLNQNKPQKNQLQIPCRNIFQTQENPFINKKVIEV